MPAIQTLDSGAQAVRVIASPAVQRRRNTDRLGYSARVVVTWGERRFQAHSADVSETGIFIETTNLLPVGAWVRVEFSVSGANWRQTVRADGLVVRHVTVGEAADRGLPPGLGIGFETIGDGRAVLSRFISEILSARFKRRLSLVERERRHPRTLVALPVFWGPDSDLAEDGYLQTLSTTGAFLDTRAPEPVGTHIHLWYELPAAGAVHGVMATAFVTDVDPADEGGTPGMTIVFETSTADASLVERFVASRLRHEATFEGATARTDLADLIPDRKRLEPLLLASMMVGVVVSLLVLILLAYG